MPDSPPDSAFSADAIIPYFSGTSALGQSLRHSPAGLHIGNVYRGPEQLPGHGLLKSIGMTWLRNLFGNEPRQMAAQAPPVNRFAPVTNFTSGADNTYSMLSRFRPVPNMLEQIGQFSPKLAPSADLLNSIANDPFVMQQIQQSPMGSMTRSLF